MFIKSTLAAAVAVLALASSADAAVFTVDALANSSSGGTGKASINLVLGQAFTVTASTNDLWSAGALPRFSDADGLTFTRFATAADDSGQPVGTQIGANFGLWSQNGLNAPFGNLVGEIGGVYMALGTNFSGNAWGTGTLNLYYWDSNASDNTGFINADVSAVPELESWVMLVAGFGMVGAVARRRKQSAKLA